MTIFVTRQLRATVDSIRNSCDVLVGVRIDVLRSLSDTLRGKGTLTGKKYASATGALVKN